MLIIWYGGAASSFSILSVFVIFSDQMFCSMFYLLGHFLFKAILVIKTDDFVRKKVILWYGGAANLLFIFQFLELISTRFLIFWRGSSIDFKAIVILQIP